MTPHGIYPALLWVPVSLDVKNIVGIGYTYFVTFFLAFRFAGTLAGTLAYCDTRGYVTHSSHNTDIILRKLSSHTGYCVAPTGESSS